MLGEMPKVGLVRELAGFLVVGVAAAVKFTKSK
jgi:hypothetical protein